MSAEDMPRISALTHHGRNTLAVIKFSDFSSLVSPLAAALDTPAHACADAP